MYGARRGCLSARLRALLKIWSGYMAQETVYHLTGIQFMNVVDSGHPSDIHGLVTVQLRDITRELTIRDIRMTVSLAHRIPETDRRWFVNRRIDLRTFTKIYKNHRGSRIK